MAEKPIVFAMANPDPEVDPAAAAKYAAVVASGRSDFPNQINNVLAFPGVFRGALDVRASGITEGMKLAAADAIAAVVGDDLTEDCVVPSVFDSRVGPNVAKAVADSSGDRRAAPLTCYLAGQILAGEDDPEARVARIRALADELGE